MRHIKNVLNDPRLQGKLKIELVVFGDGVAVFQKHGSYKKNAFRITISRGILAQFENTLKERKIEKDFVYSFINYIPSGNGEIIIRHYQGWLWYINET